VPRERGARNSMVALSSNNRPDTDRSSAFAVVNLPAGEPHG